MTTAAPETPVDWDEWVHSFDSPEKVMNAFNDGSFQANFKKYLDSEHPDMQEIRAQFAETRAQSIKAMYERNGVDTKGLKLDLAMEARSRGAKDIGSIYFNPEAPGAKLDGKFTSTGHAYQAALKAVYGDQHPILTRIKVDEELRGMMAYGTTDPASGGFLVPEEVRSDIMTRALEYEVVRPQAQVVPMPSGELRWPINDMSTEVGEVYGGIYAQWVAEGEEIPETEGKFAMVKLSANKLAALASVPNELLRSAPAFQAWLTTNMPKAMGHVADLAHIKGNGVGKPLGGLHADNPALITVNKETGQPAATITWINILDMVARMLPESLESAEWDVTPDALREVMTMALSVGTGGSAVMMNDATQGGKPTLFGRPIRWLRKAPAVLGTKGDISLVDWSNYVIGDTQAMALESSSHQKFSSDKTMFRNILRGDGQPGMLSSLTPENNGPTLSSYVQLETRA